MVDVRRSTDPYLSSMEDDNEHVDLELWVYVRVYANMTEYTHQKKTEYNDGRSEIWIVETWIFDLKNNNFAREYI